MNTQVVQTSKVKELSRPLVMFTFLLGIFMGALDHGIVGPALSSILSAYQLSSSWGVWSFTMYTLFFAVSIPVLGKLSDRFGRKQIFTFGIVTFAVGSILAAFAPNFSLFLFGRAVQAIGTGGIFPITAAQIAAMYPPERRGKALGLIGVFFGIGTILGPVIGGGIVAYLPWQWIFLINIPISLVILVMIARFRTQHEVVKKPVDIAGIVILTLLIVSVMLGITQKSGWYIVAALALLPVFIVIERKHQDPVLNVKYFTGSKTLALLISSLLSGFVMATAMNLMPLYAETLLGLTKGLSGLTVAPMAAASVIASLAAGFLTDKMGAKKVLLLGFVITALGALSLALMPAVLIVYLVTLALMGFGIGIIIGAPLNVLMIQAVEPKKTGAAVGYLSLFRSLGSTLGPTVAGQFLSAAAQGFTGLYMVSAAASVLSVLLLLGAASLRR
ncbi:MFS transporter [Paenibacillus ehimensis]|uniref:MFS transporter n=1 Tax=Paenibacillus ehimensis TaxID=79264 RepID=A0ABT8VLS0_9BACL|nr:MFS transporter [Paenibacillus ehimensis]MDO3681930.1 MFS transporter [Paenibacillus ehimensis]